MYYWQTFHAEQKLCVDLKLPMQNSIVQSIELQQGNRGGTRKSRQNSQGTGIAKLAGDAPLMEPPI